MKNLVMRNGVIRPEEPPPKPPKVYGPVELRDENLRERVAGALTGALNSFELRFTEPFKQEKRDYLYSVIASLLGDDFGFEEKT